MYQRCETCKQRFSVVQRVNDCCSTIETRALYCPICGAGQYDEKGVRSGVLRIGEHTWRVHIHPEFSRHDIEFRDGAGNTLVIMRNVE